MASDPLRDFSTGLLILGGVLLVVALGLVAAEALVATTGGRGYAFSSVGPTGVAAAIVSLSIGSALRVSMHRRGTRAR